VTFWLDAHLSDDLAAWLGSRYKIVVKPIRELGLRDAKDPALFQAAKRFANIVVVTKDDDFAEMVERLGSPPQVVWLTVGNLTTLELQAVLAKVFDKVIERLSSGETIVEVSR
jgi:predicted nuclease of predicted toxin-antitoxin system